MEKEHVSSEAIDVAFEEKMRGRELNPDFFMVGNQSETVLNEVREILAPRANKIIGIVMGTLEWYIEFKKGTPLEKLKYQDRIFINLPSGLPTNKSPALECGEGMGIASKVFEIVTAARPLTFKEKVLDELEKEIRKCVDQKIGKQGQLFLLGGAIEDIFTILGGTSETEELVIPFANRLVGSVSDRYVKEQLSAFVVYKSYETGLQNKRS